MSVNDPTEHRSGPYTRSAKFMTEPGEIQAFGVVPFSYNFNSEPPDLEAETSINAVRG